METSGAFPCGAIWGDLTDWGLARTANLCHTSGSHISPRARVACTLKACELCSCPALRPETAKKKPRDGNGFLDRGSYTKAPGATTHQVWKRAGGTCQQSPSPLRKEEATVYRGELTSGGLISYQGIIKPYN